MTPLPIRNTWTRTGARGLLIGGLAAVAVGLTIAIIWSTEAINSYLGGALIGSGLVFAFMGVRLIIRWRGMSDDEIAVNNKQLYDERWQAARAKGFMFGAIVAALYMLGCSIFYFARQETLTGWIFIGGMCVLSMAMLIATRWQLRRL